MGENAKSLKFLTLDTPTNINPDVNSLGPGFKITLSQVFPCNLCIDRAYPEMRGIIVLEHVACPCNHFQVIGTIGTECGTFSR